MKKILLIGLLFGLALPVGAQVSDTIRGKSGGVVLLPDVATNNAFVIGDQPVTGGAAIVVGDVSPSGNNTFTGTNTFKKLKVTDAKLPDGTSLVDLSGEIVFGATLNSDPILDQSALVVPSGTNGPPGVQGPPGMDGPEGDMGPEGPQGADGDQGQQGLDGPQGDQGPEGERGPQGDMGEKGYQGPQGDQGPEGPQGNQGQRGYDGDQGPWGDKGTTGDQGPQGDPGPQGQQGDTGTELSEFAGLSTAADSIRYVSGSFYPSYVVSLNFAEAVGEIAQLELLSKMATGFSYLIRTAEGVSTNEYDVSWVVSKGKTSNNQQFLYTTNNGEIAITRYLGWSSDVTIPSTIDGLPVTRVGTTFKDCAKDLTSLSLGYNLKEIESGAFSNCPNIQSLTIQRGVTNIGAGAFYGCTALVSLKLNCDAPTVGSEAFSGNSLAKVLLQNYRSGYSGTWQGVTTAWTNTISSDNFQYVVNSGDATILGYSDDPQNWVGVVAGDFIIPAYLDGNPVKEVGKLKWGMYPGQIEDANCGIQVSSNLIFEAGILNIRTNFARSVGFRPTVGALTLPSTLTNVSYLALYGVTVSNNIVVVPDSVKTIDQSAFGGSKFQNLVIGSNVVSIGPAAFASIGLTNLLFKGNAPSVGNIAFFDSGALLTNKMQYYEGATGFTNIWYGWPTEAIARP